MIRTYVAPAALLVLISGCGGGTKSLADGAAAIDAGTDSPTDVMIGTTTDADTKLDARVAVDAPTTDAAPPDVVVDGGAAIDAPEIGTDAGDDRPRAKALSVKLAVGLQHACARMSDGRVKCWGDNMWGQLGDETRTSSAAPVDVVGVADVIDVAAARNASCALRADGTVLCWGGLTEAPALGAAAKNPGVSGAVAITGARDHMCAVLATGHVVCWGANDRDQLGDTSDLTDGPVEVAGLEGVTAASAGFNHTCALAAGGSVWCWGGGLMFDGAARVPGLAGATAVSAVEHDSCAVVGTTVWCWADNSHGENEPGWVPARLSSIIEPVAIAGSCARRADGMVLCWPPPMGPVDRVQGLDHVISIAADGEAGRACALRDPGIVFCWPTPLGNPLTATEVAF